ncbi:MAG TPA: hypothetical protein VL282_07820 [Tepidisphaeraceae bacterium]|jgi:hypothetical protein|nr:hypothetical protein [Tepidisphaeraceae bacterium]
MRLSTDLDLIRFPRDASANAGRTRAVEQALAGYQKALAKNPSDYWSHLQVGRCIRETGRAR